MEVSINKRLAKYLHDVNIDEPTLYKDLGVTKSLWSEYKRAVKPISVEKIVKLLSERKDLNARWFLTGEGSMLNDGNPSNVIDGFKITEVGCPLCNPREREITIQTKLIKVLEEQKESLEAKIRDLEKSQNKKPAEKIGYKKDEPGIDKAAETTGKYKVSNLRELKLNASLSDRVD